MLNKILSIASISGVLSSLNLTRKFVASFAIIIALTIIGAILASALILFGLYEGYTAFIRHGIDADIAALNVFLITLFVLLSVITCIIFKLKRLQAVPLGCSSARVAGESAMVVLQGFWRGLTEKKPS